MQKKILICLIFTFNLLHCYSQDFNCNQFIQKLDSLKDLRYGNPQKYISTLDQLKETAFNSTCIPESMLIQLDIYAVQLYLRTANSREVWEILEDDYLFVSNQDSTYTQVSEVILSTLCALEGQDLAKHESHKYCELLQLFLKENHIPSERKTRLYINLIRSAINGKMSDSNKNALILEATNYVKDKGEIPYKVLLTDIGYFYYAREKGKLQETLNYYLKAQEINTSSDYAYSLLNLRLIEFYLSQNLFQQILDLYETIDLDRLTFKTKYNILAILSYSYAKESKFPEAEASYNNFLSLQKNEKIDNSFEYSIIQQLTLAMILEHKNKIKEAYESLVTNLGDSTSFKYKFRFSGKTINYIILLHHIMKIENKLESKTAYDTFENHMLVYDKLKNKNENIYPFYKREILLYEVQYIQKHYKTKLTQNEIFEIQKFTISTIDQEEKSKLKLKLIESILNKKKAELYASNEIISKSNTIDKKYKKTIFLGIAVLILAIIVTFYNVFRNNRIKKEKADLLSLNTFYIKKAKFYKELKDKNRSYFSEIAHDIRSPLTKLSNINEKLKDSTNDTSILKTLNESRLINKEIDRMVNDLESYLFEKEKLNGNNKEEITIKNHVDNCLKLVDPSLLRLITFSFEGLSVIKAHRPTLQTIFKNTIENTLKHSNQMHPKILIRCSQNKINAKYIFEIIDNGLNINSPTEISHLNSFGLGLQICKSATERIGGSFESSYIIPNGFKVKFEL